MRLKVMNNFSCLLGFMAELEIIPMKYFIIGMPYIVAIILVYFYDIVL